MSPSAAAAATSAPTPPAATPPAAGLPAATPPAASPPTADPPVAGPTPSARRSGRPTDGTRRCDVLVVGGGPAGAATAYWLASAGHDVVVVTGTIPRRRPHALTPDGWLRTGDIAVVDDERLPLPRRPGQGPHHRVGVQRLPGRGRGGAARAPRRRGRRGGRRRPPLHRRGGQGLRRGRRGHALEEDEVIDFCASRLARYKCPSKVMFVDEIPTGLAGKVLRRAPPASAACAPTPLVRSVRHVHERPR